MLGTRAQRYNEPVVTLLGRQVMAGGIDLWEVNLLWARDTNFGAVLFIKDFASDFNFKWFLHGSVKQYSVMLDLVFSIRNWKEKLCSIQHLRRSLKFVGSWS